MEVTKDKEPAAALTTRCDQSFQSLGSGEPVVFQAAIVSLFFFAFSQAPVVQVLATPRAQACGVVQVPNMAEETELLEVPAGPTPMPLLGNYADLTEGFHVAMPRLIREYADHGIFTIQIPAGKIILPMSHFGGPTIVLANPVLLEEMYRRPEDFNKLLFKHSMLRRINAPSLLHLG